MNKIAISCAILSIFSFAAQAESPSFNFVEVGYTDGLDSDSFDGFEVNANFELNESYYLNANYMNSNETDGGAKFDLTGYVFGFGYKNNFSKSSTFFTQFDYVKVEADMSFSGFSYSDSENGLQVSAGVRSIVSENLELSAALKYIDVEESDTLAKFGAVYNFTDQAGLYFNIDTDFHDGNYALGLRVSF
jgi:hypothetical protein